MYKKNILLFFLFSSIGLFAQIGVGTISPHPSSILDVESTEKGFLPPRVSSDASVSNPAEGLVIYDMSDNCLNVWNNNSWINLCSGSGGNISSSLANLYQEMHGTELRFNQVLTDNSKHRGGGIDENNNIFMWGSQTASNVGAYVITKFNGHVPTNSTRLKITSPYWLNHPDINGKAKQFGHRNSGATYYALTTDGIMYGWGQGINGALGGIFYNAPNPVIVPLPSGVLPGTKIKEFGVFISSENCLVILTEEGKAYVKGATATSYGVSVNSYSEIAFPSTVSDPNFKYIDIIQDKDQINGSNVIYLKGSNNNIYATGKNTYFCFGNSNVNRDASFNITQPASIKKVNFPVGASEIISISKNQYQHMAIDADGKVYAWGLYEYSPLGAASDTRYFEIDPSTPTVYSNSFLYVEEPTLVNLPTGVNKAIDISVHSRYYATGIVGDNNKSYLIGDLSNYNFHYSYGNNVKSHYSQILNFAHIPIQKMSLNETHIQVLDVNNQMWWSGRSLSYVAGGKANATLSGVNKSESSLVPLLGGHFDPDHDFVQTIN